MSRRKTLERLLRIREIQEEQKKLRLDAAQATLKSLQRARDAAAEMERGGRALAAASVISGELADRQAGLMQTEFARRRARMLAPWIASTQKETVELRRDFMDKRMQRRQAETLVGLEDTRDKVESDRRAQRNVDDWYGARKHQKGSHDQTHQ